MNDKRTDDENRGTNSPTPKPDSETLHKTDPQESMKGPLSSLMHNTGEEFESDKTQEEADKKREEHM